MLIVRINFEQSSYLKSKSKKEFVKMTHLYN